MLAVVVVRRRQMAVSISNYEDSTSNRRDFGCPWISIYKV